MERTVYRPYGEAVAPGVGAPNSPPEFGFTGQRFVKAAEIYDYGARMYDPTLGRFLQPDVLVPEPFNPQNLNRYSYVLNDPTNRIDPSGNLSFHLTGAATFGGTIYDDPYTGTSTVQLSGMTYSFYPDAPIVVTQDRGDGSRTVEPGRPVTVERFNNVTSTVQRSPASVSQSGGGAARSNPFAETNVAIGVLAGGSAVGGVAGVDANAFGGLEFGGGQLRVRAGVSTTGGLGNQTEGRTIGGELDADLAFVVAESFDALVARDTFQVDINFAFGPSVKIFSGPSGSLRGIAIGVNPLVPLQVVGPGSVTFGGTGTVVDLLTLGALFSSEVRVGPEAIVRYGGR